MAPFAVQVAKKVVMVDPVVEVDPVVPVVQELLAKAIMVERVLLEDPVVEVVLVRLDNLVVAAATTEVVTVVQDQPVQSLAAQ
jgi:hypothetical protein